MAETRRIQTIRNQVYQILKDDICSGMYPPGTWLQEKELTERLAVSRSPVRDALHQLCSDGLAVEYPNKGVYVRNCTPQDIRETLDMRLLLENHAIAQLKLPLSSEGQERLLSCLEALESAYHTHDLRRYTEEDAQLHNMLVTLSNNQLLIVMYERIHAMTQLFRIFSLVSQKRFDESIDEHRTLIQSVLDGRSEDAQSINTRHLNLASETVLAWLEQRTAAENPHFRN